MDFCCAISETNTPDNEFAQALHNIDSSLNLPKEQIFI